MSGIASIVRSRGISVSGSDAKESHTLNLLRRQGINAFVGHNLENIYGADLVVYSSAIKADNPEFIEAKKRDIKLIKRAECLAQLMNDKISITVSGAHGKTTTTSLASFLLTLAGLRPTAAVGGIVRNWGNNICLGNSDYFVAEADESDGTFLEYNPTYSIITNIDCEHMDYYKDYESVIAAFAKFVERTKDSGCVIACGDDENIAKILSATKKRHITFGLKVGCDVSAKNIECYGNSSRFECIYYKKSIGQYEVSLPGLHNLSNSLSVIALGRELSIKDEVIRGALLNYQGSERRFQIKMSTDKYMVVDDYAHHPTEIRATLSAARGFLGDACGRNYKRIIAVFQPHRYSRTKLLLDEFVKSFDEADCLFITEIYPANEAPIPGISGSLIYEKMRETNRLNAEFIKKDKILLKILDIVNDGDLIITLGAGDIGKLSDELSSRLIRKCIEIR